MSENNKGDWFDDPEWSKLRQQVAGQKAQKPSRGELKAFKKQQREIQQQRDNEAKRKLEAESRARGEAPAEPKNVNVSVNLTLPNLRAGKHIGTLKQKATGGLNRVTPKPVKTQLQKRSRKQLAISSAVAVVMVVALIGVLTLAGGGSKGKGADTAVLAEKTVKIDFKPLVPNGKTDETTAHKTAEDGQGRPIFTFTDKIGLVDLTVTEQPLPEKLKASTDSELEKMAKDLYLTDVINASNPKAYMGTSVKGPQTVIFAKDGLLVFIQSQSKIDKDQWSDYVTRLIQ